MSLLSKTFQSALTEHNLSFRAWAKAAGTHYRTAHNCLQNDSRPSDALLRAFCSKWPKTETGINLLRAYLRDEVRRAGFSATDVEILLPGEMEGPNLDRDLATLRNFVVNNPDLRVVIRKIAAIADEEVAQNLQRAMFRNAGIETRHVAEDPPPKT